MLHSRSFVVACVSSSKTTSYYTGMGWTSKPMNARGFCELKYAVATLRYVVRRKPPPYTYKIVKLIFDPILEDVRTYRVTDTGGLRETTDPFRPARGRGK